jgi:hypothetical protein
LPDNAAVFTGSSCGHGWVALERTLIGLGIALRHSRRLHHLGIGRRHAGIQVLMLVRDLDIRVVDEETGDLLAAFTLDYQHQQRAARPEAIPAPVRPVAPRPSNPVGARR